LKFNKLNKMSGRIILILLLSFSVLGYSQNKSTDSLKTKKVTGETKKAAGDTSKVNTLQIDTSKIINQIDTSNKTAIKTDSLINVSEKESVRFTNVNLFIYILISLAGAFFFFFLFVKTLFRTFHKTKSTRQSLLLSWNLFFVVTVIWIFIVWGIIAGLWSSAPFMTVLIFLFIVSLIMSIIALKSK
jgi:membrane-associated HD superfamily phosphohydrolase